MKQGCLAVLGVLLTSAGFTFAQATSLAPQAPLTFADLPTESPTRPGGPPDNPERPFAAVWTEVSYLLWWDTNGPLKVPLVTRGNPSDPIPGALGQPGTSVLFGDNTLNYNALSGARFTAGAWLDNEGTLGLEGSGFFLGQRGTSFAAASNAANPALYVPLYLTPGHTEGSYTLADPLLLGGVNGGFVLNSTSQLWGAEINGLANLYRDQVIHCDALIGGRYLQLKESLTLGTSSNLTTVDEQISTTDSFSTSNQFYGGQVGLRAGAQYGMVDISVVTKVALGATNQVVDIRGYTSNEGAGAANPGVFPGGLFSQSSNMGQSSHSAFTVVPQVGGELSCQITSWLRGFAGYDFLYWSSVVRPGNQIDQDINFSQSQVFGVGQLSGPARPAPVHDATGFIAQGVSFGLEFGW